MQPELGLVLDLQIRVEIVIGGAEQLARCGELVQVAIKPAHHNLEYHLQVVEPTMCRSSSLMSLGTRMRRQIGSFVPFSVIFSW
jgi:hypothetical protein